jgi:4'-phosphopantetheinyl transferase
MTHRTSLRQVRGNDTGLPRACRSEALPCACGRPIRQNDAVQMRLAQGDVHVWCRATDSLGDADIKAAVTLLSPEERSRYARFRFARDQRDYAAAHALLRLSLSRYADVTPRSWQFREASGGKPLLVLDEGMPRLSFNLSHTHGLVACAIASGSDVGVDVESVDRQVGDGVAERFFSESENADLRGRAPGRDHAHRFFELWTLKEAYVKAIGKGLSHPLDTIVFRVGNDGSITFIPPPETAADCWRFALFSPTEHHRLAVAARSDDDVASRIQMMPAAGEFRG